MTTTLVFAATLGSAWAFGGLAAWLDWYGGPGPIPQVDGIVVAGCRVMPDGSPSPALARRVALAVKLFRAGHAERLLFTGGVGADAPISEGRASAALAERLGVPAAAILVEEASVDTLENAALAARLWSQHLGPARDAKILVVTDRSHVFRCTRVFGAHFAQVAGAGATPPLGSRLRMAAREGVSVLHHGVRGRLWAPSLSSRL